MFFYVDHPLRQSKTGGLEGKEGEEGGVGRGKRGKNVYATRFIAWLLGSSRSRVEINEGM